MTYEDDWLKTAVINSRLFQNELIKKIQSLILNLDDKVTKDDSKVISECHDADTRNICEKKVLKS